jgi:hypothetical protein
MALVYLTNSYLETADDYLADNPVWEAASSDEQEQALIDATRVLDQNQWLGVAVSSSQSLAWPRTKISFFDPVLGLEVLVTQGTVPARLQKATAYLALHFLKYPEVTRGYEASFDEISVGPISIKNTDAASSGTKPPLVPAEISNFIAPLLSDSFISSRGNWWRSN